ncbi:unnamed protein product [Ranitomeya imitator]|uniref:Reverse transcriptase RNase H-like domain-containing protein n=1 Tax=Ranitomeya imitator TaxID=111125 RepID=A0ABN9LZC7_9NEOB|nr:unnamed protein product [Ranitomeya imitator]
MDPVKVQAIYDWTQPTSVKSLQKFLAFANFYRRFIANFSTVAKPLTDLTKKGADVVNWSSAAVEAFQELKRRFSSAPVLCQPDVSLPFQVEVDASEIGAGAVLSQRSSDGSVMKPCAFFSRKFSPAERNYDVGNRELLAMKWAFEEWRHWLEGAKHRMVVLTDHKNLTYLESAKWLNPRQARWLLFCSRFDFVVSYLPGSKNVKADALSRSFVPDSPGVPEPAGILKEGVESSDCPGVDTVVDRLQQIWTHVVDNLTLSQEKAQRFANHRRCVGPRLRVGDFVWLSSRYVPMKVSSPKFKPRFIGPYKISEVINPVSFRLALPASFAIHNVFHRSLLRRYVAPVVPSVDPPAPLLVEGELEYVVEKILDSRVSRRKNSSTWSSGRVMVRKIIPGFLPLMFMLPIWFVPFIWLILVGLGALNRDLEHESRRAVNLELHIITIAEYLRVQGIPRGLRVPLQPTFFREDKDYCTKFEHILNKCSADLMTLTLSYLQKNLDTVNAQINAIDSQLTSTMPQEEFQELKIKNQELLLSHRLELEKREKIEVSERHRGLFTEPSLPVAGYSAFHQATQLSKLFWFHRQQARHLKFFYLPFFFREQPRPSKGKMRWRGQCHRGTQKPDGNTLTGKDLPLVVNISSKNLDTHQLAVLQKGLSFCPMCKFNSFELSMDLQRFYRNLRLRVHFSEQPPALNPSRRDKTLLELCDLGLWTHSSYMPPSPIHQWKLLFPLLREISTH